MIRFLTNALTLARASNLPTVWTNVVIAWTINATASSSLKIIPPISDLSFFKWNIFAYLIIGGSFIYGAGCTLNDAFDQKFDKKYNPERPIPAGVIKPEKVWILGFTELITGSILLVWGALCDPIWVGCLLLAVVIYDVVHKKWVGGIVVMGLCRLFLWLTAATAMGLSEIAPQTWIWGIVLTVYIIGISLFARGESKKQSESNRYSILFLFSSPMVTLIALVYWNQLDPIRIFLANITGLLIGWIAYSSILIIKEQKKGAVGKGVSRLLAGICALDATAISLYCPTLIAPTLCCLSLCVLLQKKFAAT